MKHKVMKVCMCFLMILVVCVNSFVFAIDDEEIELDPQASSGTHQSNFTLEKNTDGTNTYTIVGYTSKIYTNIIPGVIDGKIVTRIGARAFKDMDQLSGEITIPDSIIVIDDEAFSGCTKVMGLVIGKNVTTIGNEAFFGCSSMEKIKFNTKLTTIGNSAFENCKELRGKSIVIPDTVTKVGSYVFGNTGIESIKFSSNTAPKITKYTFADMESTKIIVPQSGIGYIEENYWPDKVHNLIFGDVNDDGLVNVEDSALILDLFKYGGETAYHYSVGDINKDGILNVEDAGMILDMYKGLR